jgi:hypothetical protein
VKPVVPNINANATVLAGATTTIIIYLATLLGGTTVPGDVGSAITTALAVLFGVGFGYSNGGNAK